MTTYAVSTRFGYGQLAQEESRAAIDVRPDDATQRDGRSPQCAEWRNAGRAAAGDGNAAVGTSGAVLALLSRLRDPATLQRLVLAVPPRHAGAEMGVR